MLQLQYLSYDGKENLGGLYVMVEEVAAVYFRPIEGHHNRGVAMLVLKSGKEFTLADQLIDVLDELMMKKLHKQVK